MAHWVSHLPKLRALCTRLNLSILAAFSVVVGIAWLIVDGRRKLFGAYTFPYDYVPILIPLFFLLAIGFLLLTYGIEQWKATYCDRFLWLPLVISTVLGVLSAVVSLLGFAASPFQPSFLPSSFRDLLASEVYLFSLETPIPLAVFLCLFSMSYCAMSSVKFELLFARLALLFPLSSSNTLAAWLPAWLHSLIPPPHSGAATSSAAWRARVSSATSSNATVNSSSSSILSVKLSPASIALLALFVAVNWVAGPWVAVYVARIMITEGYLGSFRTAFALVGITRVLSLTNLWALLFRDAAFWSTVAAANVIAMVAFYKFYVQIFLLFGVFQDFPTVDSSFVSSLDSSVFYFYLLPLVGAMLTRFLVRGYLELSDFYDRFLTRFVFLPISCLAMIALSYLVLNAQDISMFSEYPTIAKSFKICFIYFALVFVLIMASFVVISTLFPPRPTAALNHSTTSTASTLISPSSARWGPHAVTCLKRLFSHFLLDVFYDPSAPPTNTAQLSDYSLFEDLVTVNNFQLTAVPITIGIWGVQSQFTIVALSGFLVEIFWTFFLTIVANHFFKKFALWNTLHEPHLGSFV